MIADFVNGAYELLGGLFVILNCRRLYKDKTIKGIDWRTVTFFTSWGWWNLYFYPAVGAWLSFAGGVGLVAANTVWLSMMVYYLRRQKQYKNQIEHLNRRTEIL